MSRKGAKEGQKGTQKKNPFHRTCGMYGELFLFGIPVRFLRCSCGLSELRDRVVRLIQTLSVGGGGGFSVCPNTDRDTEAVRRSVPAATERIQSTKTKKERVRE